MADKLKAIQGGKAKTKFDKKSMKALNTVDQEEVVYKILCGRDGFMASLGAEFDLRYYLHFGLAGDPVILKKNVEDNTFRILEDNYLISDIYHQYNEFIVKNALEEDVGKISTVTVARGVKAWIYQRNKNMNNNILDEFPVQTRFKSEEGTCFTRLDYDPLKVDNLEEDAPLFNKMLKRMRNNEAFVRKVGSLFDKDAYRKQSIWLYGPTDGGKSAIQKLLEKIMGGTSNSVAMTPKLMENDFFKEILVGKSLWLVREAKTSFLNSDDYKSLTGDESHIINPKGKRMFSVSLSGHLIFSSNESPEIRNEDALLRRVIPCFCERVSDEDKMDEKTLWEKLTKELPYIVGYCIEKYSEHSRGYIDFDQSDLIEAIEDGDWEMQALFDRFFEPDDNAVGKNCTVTAAYLVSRIDPRGNGRSTLVKNFRRFLERKYGSNTKQQVRVDDKVIKYISKIRKLPLHCME